MLHLRPMLCRDPLTPTHTSSPTYQHGYWSLTTNCQRSPRSHPDGRQPSPHIFWGAGSSLLYARVHSVPLNRTTHRKQTVPIKFTTGPRNSLPPGTPLPACACRSHIFVSFSVDKLRLATAFNPTSRGLHRLPTLADMSSPSEGAWFRYLVLTLEHFFWLPTWHSYGGFAAHWPGPNRSAHASSHALWPVVLVCVFIPSVAFDTSLSTALMPISCFVSQILIFICTPYWVHALSQGVVLRGP